MPYVVTEEMRIGEEQIYRALDIYKAIAKHPETAPQGWVDRLFNVMKNRLPKLIDHWSYSQSLTDFAAENCDDPWERRREYKLSNQLNEVLNTAISLEAQFEQAYSRKDKIIAIDAFMHAQHINGPFLTRLFLLDSPINQGINTHVNRILGQLSRRAVKGNPVDEREQMRLRWIDNWAGRIRAAKEMAAEVRAAGGRLHVSDALAYVTIYHGTSQENANKIMREGQFNEWSFFSFAKTRCAFGSAGPASYGKVVLEIKADARDLNFNGGSGEIEAEEGLARGNDGIWQSPKRRK